MKTIRCLVMWTVLASGAALAATVSRVDGEVVEVRDAAGARVGDAVEILTRLPGFDELAKVGTGRVLSVSGGGWTARIEQRSGALAVGQEARLMPRSTAPGRSMDALTPTTPTTPSAAPGSLEQQLNTALQQGAFERLSAIVGPNREVTLRGSVASAAEKQRALDLARNLARAPVKDQVFIVEP